MAFSSRTYSVPIDSSQVPTWVSEITVSQYFQVATLTILVYDALITMDKESKYFWKKTRRTVDIIYFANRYIGIFGAVAHLLWNTYDASLRLCNFSQWANGIAAWITIVLIDYVLMIRVLALYSQDRILSIILKTLLVLAAAFKVTMTIYLDSLLHITVGSLAKGITVCGYRTDLPWHWGMVDWLIPMLYGIILLALALRRTIQYSELISGFKWSPLVKVIIQDQILYFFLAVFCFVLSILSFRVLNTFSSNILSSLGNPNLLSLVGSHLLFSLKEVGDWAHSEGPRVYSTVEFVDPGNSRREAEP